MLGSNPLKVYTVLYDAAARDVRGDCGGTTNWSIKGLASELGVRRETVAAALNKLLDNGFIQVAGESTNKGGSHNTVWRVTHPNMLDAVRYANDIMGPPSERLKKMRNKQKKVFVEFYEDFE